MHAYISLGMLALAGSVLSTPHRGFHGGYPGGDGGHVHIVYETAIVTVLVGPDGQPLAGAAPTEPPQQGQPYFPFPKPTDVPASPPETPPAPEPYTPEPSPPPPPSYEAPAPPAPTSAPPAPPAPEPTYAPAPAPAPDSGYMGIVNKWRAKIGKGELTHSDKLEANDLKTCADGHGQMVHQLLDGTFGQVLAPGSMDEFEKIFVGGWLCEMPNMPGLDGICASMSQGWAYDGQTGHAEILSNDGYKNIGCACSGGICGCDFS